MARRLLEKEEFLLNDEKEIENIVLYEKDPQRKIAWITFNNPDKMNALPVFAFDRAAELVRDAEYDNDVKIIIFRGNGPCFGTGADAGELGYYIGYGTGKTPEERKRPSQLRRMLADRAHVGGLTAFDRTVFHCIKATICQVHSFCYGGHFQIANSADIVIATPDAMFAHPAWRYLGPLMPWAQMIDNLGLKKVKEICLTARPMGADEAERFGLVTKVVPNEDLEKTVLDFAQAINMIPMDNIAVGKALIELNMEARGLGVGYWSEWAGHGWTTNMAMMPGEWNFLKERRDKGLTQALEERDMMVAPQFRWGKGRFLKE